MSADGLPAGYGLERERGVCVVALPSFMEPVKRAVREAGSLHAWAAGRPDARALAGRGIAYGVELAGERCVVRHYRRGGFIARLSNDRYVRGGEPRPVRELHASLAARAAGVPTPEVVAAVIHMRTFTYSGDIATRYIPESADLASVTWQPATSWSGAERAAAWHAAGALLRRAFDAGVRHPDLNLRNILIAREAGAVHALLLDLDRAAVREPDDVARRAMLARFHRSRRKLERSCGTAVDASLLQALEDGLAGRGGGP